MLCLKKKQKVYLEAKHLSTDKLEKRLKKLKNRFDKGDCSVVDKNNVTYKVCSDGIKRLTLKDEKRSQPGDQKIAEIIYVVDLMLEGIEKNKRATHRGAFYLLEEEFSKEADVSDLIDIICCTIGCSSSNIYIEAGERGVITGPLSWKEKNLVDDREYAWDCESRPLGVSIPPPSHEISDLVLRKERKPLFILVVEKQSVLAHIRLSEYYKKWPCILISGKGMPDVATRRLLKMLSDKFYDLPVYGLFDCDPYGIRIFTCYTVGSKAKAYDSVNLTCPHMRWVGLWPTDIPYLIIPPEFLNQDEIKVVKDLLREKFVVENRMLTEELKHMKNTKLKANLDALKDKYGTEWPSDFLESKIINLRF